MFALDPRLEQDTFALGDFPLCRLLLSKDANYPWFILVPRRAGISEIFQLDDSERQQLWKETDFLSKTLKDCFAADKMNVAALGNVVSQLHMHVIVRRRNDAAWPAPVWGQKPASEYSADQLNEVRRCIAQVMGDDFRFAEA
ncbi:HIT family protein [Pseudomonas putida]|uniref:HIT domain-containing protein n=1 Tax=Pseudomonas putida TaxID=303 RepID=A0A1Q9QWP6_PSEPU|nr:HIT domain-containing protein [Pseudomonas putida]OLS59576.1 hypothetical protein PSEMO_55450 [Pseudomonas putida]